MHILKSNLSHRKETLSLVGSTHLKYVLLPISQCGARIPPRTEVNIRLMFVSTSRALDARDIVLKMPSQNVPFPSTFLLPPLEKILGLGSNCYELRCLPCAPTENNGR